MSNNIEYRIAPAPALKQKVGAKPILSGYAALFGSRYSMGWFTEEIHRDAFKSADLSDVRILFNHDPSLILGRTTSGTARVWADHKGLRYEVELPKSPNGKNVRVALERGDISESSWGFSIAPDSDEWLSTGGKPHRIIRSVSIVYDASPVTYPANPSTSAQVDTTAAKRSYEAFQAIAPTKEAAELLRKLDADLARMDLELQKERAETKRKLDADLARMEAELNADAMRQVDASLARMEAELNRDRRRAWW